MSDKKAFELSVGVGYLFKNSFKDNEKPEDSKKPDYTGDFNVNGEIIKVSLWKSRTKKGDPMLKLGVYEPRAGAKPTNSQLSADDLPF